MKYKWLLFDVDNTLMDFDQSAKMALIKTFEQYNIPYEKYFIETYYQVNKECWEAFEREEFTAKQIREDRFSFFLNKIKLDGNGKKMGFDYLAYLGSFHYMLDGAYQLLDQVSSTHQLALVTNGLREVQHPRLKDADLKKYFQAIVISDEIGVSKPHPDFFDYTFQQINSPPKDQVLMIGDSLSSDIAGGNGYGVDTCWYNPKGLENTKNIKPTYEINELSELLNIVSITKTV